MIVCAAAGNEHRNSPFYPAAYSDALILAVGATDQFDQKAGLSNYGPWVDVSAPGVEILSTCLSGGTCIKSGTSMATPHVTGLAALLLSRFSGWSPGVMTDVLLNSVRLVDGLQEHGYKVHLANPSAIKQYEGIKYTDDKWDSFWLAHLLRLGILPEGYIYPKEEGPVRDLLRIKLLFVRHRTSHILSLQSAITRNLGYKVSGRDIKKLNESDAEDLFDDPFLVLSAKNSISTIRFLGRKMENLMEMQLPITKTDLSIASILMKKAYSPEK